MVKQLRCRDLGLNCAWEVRAESEQEIMNQVAQHLQRAHSMPLGPELERKFVQAIRSL